MSDAPLTIVIVGGVAGGAQQLHVLVASTKKQRSYCSRKTSTYRLPTAGFPTIWAVKLLSVPSY